MIFGFLKKLVKYYIDKLVYWLRMQKFNLELDNVSGMMPKMLDQGLPKITGPSMPISDTMSDDSKWFWDYIEKRNKEYIEWETKGKWENL